MPPKQSMPRRIQGAAPAVEPPIFTDEAQWLATPITPGQGHCYEWMVKKGANKTHGYYHCRLCHRGLMKYKIKTTDQGGNKDTDYVGEIVYNHDSAPCISPGWMPTRNPGVPAQALYTKRTHSPGYPYLPSPDWPEGPLRHSRTTTRVLTDDVQRAEEGLAAATTTRRMLQVAQEARDGLRQELRESQETAEFAAARLQQPLQDIRRAQRAEVRQREADPNGSQPMSDQR